MPPKAAPHEGGFRQWLLSFCNAPTTFTHSDKAQCAKICEVMKTFLYQKAQRIIAQCKGRAVLLTYASDGTPLLTQKTYTAKTESGQTVVRKGGHGTDFLMQRAYLRTSDDKGDPIITCILADPVPMSEGKSATHQYTAAKDFLPLVKEIGHRGVCISHYCFDRAGFAPVSKLLKQRHCLYHHKATSADPSGEAHLQQRLDWTVSTACCNHDCHNALKWGLAPLHQIEDLKDLYIVVGSLRNSFDLIHSHLKTFVVENILFVAEEGDAQETYHYWVQLGVQSDVAEALADLNLQWANGHLQVNDRHKSSECLIEAICTSMLTIFKWTKFTDSRWCTIGAASRSLVASLTVGLEALAKKIRSNPKMSDWYIHGFARLSNVCKKFAVVAAIAANVCDAVLIELLHDDRVVLRLETLQKAASEELDLITELSDVFWSKLAALVPGTTAQLIRSWCMESSLTSAAFMTRKFFRVAKQLPWSLAIGDIHQNLELLALQEEPEEETASKIWQLLRMGYNRASLVEGVELLAHVHWSTGGVEQAHGSAAIVRKYHPMYSMDMVAQRSFVHMSRALLQASADDSKEARFHKQLKTLSNKNPEKITGRHIFLADCMASATGTDPQAIQWRKAVMQRHASVYQSLPLATRIEYEDRAKVKAAGSRHDLEGDIEMLQSRASLFRDRLSREHAETGAQFRVANCKFSEADVAGMWALWQSPDFSSRVVQQRRRQALEPPGPPTASALQELQGFEVSEDHLRDAPLPGWCVPICRHRDHFSSCALVFESDDHPRTFAFVFASQRPFAAAFVPLIDLPPATLGNNLSPFALEACASEVYDSSYTFVPGQFVWEADMPALGPEKVWVLQHLAWTTGTTVASHAELVHLPDFLAELPPKAEKEKPGASSSDKPKERATASGELVAQFPWLADYEKKGHETLDLESAEAEVAPKTTEPEPSELDENALENIFEEVEARRQAWALERRSAQDFTTYIRGGAWAADRSGQALEGVRSQFQGSLSKEWCKKYKMPETASFSYSKFGEAMASALALAWCARSQHYFDLFLEARDEGFVYNDGHLSTWSGDSGLDALLADLPANHVARKRWAMIVAHVPRTPC